MQRRRGEVEKDVSYIGCEYIGHTYSLGGFEKHGGSEVAIARRNVAVSSRREEEAGK